MRRRGGYAVSAWHRPTFSPSATQELLTQELLNLCRSYRPDNGFLEVRGRRLHHERSQQGMDCQLITAINAAAFLGLPTLSPYFNKSAYEGWMEYTRTSDRHHEDDIHCGRFVEFLEYLRIKTVKIQGTVEAVKRELKLGYPVELMLKFGDHPDEGSHSTLVVDTDKNRIRCTNLWDCHDGWTNWSRLSEMMGYYAKAYAGGKMIAYSYRPTVKVLMKRCGTR